MLHPYKRNNNKLRLFHFLTILSLCIITSQYNAFAKVTKGDNDDDKKNNKKGKQRKTKGKGYDLPPESALRVGVKYRPDECLYVVVSNVVCPCMLCLLAQITLHVNIFCRRFLS
mmetsp:Transcript_36341/g.53121  ORF Transcript_36341/g.53121 Transcript_36341/m.53121 type:complete len:114 (-) Transcript_36341:627-968(-)